MDKTKEEVAEILGDYFSICTTIVTEDSSNYQKNLLNYQFTRQRVLELKNQLTIPHWILSASSIPFLKAHIDSKVHGGPGSWGRRRIYLHSIMSAILDSYSNSLTRALAGGLKNAHKSDSVYIDGIESLYYANSDNVIDAPQKSEDYINQTLSRPNSNNLRQEEMKNGISTAGSPDVLRKKKVFIVHGHDELLKNQVHVFLSQEGYDPIILHEQVNKGATIIEKLEKNINTVSFAVILYTACDKGKSVKELDFKPRSRQNVVFEHGYLICKLGREKVAALKSDDVDLPGDLSGLITISASNWKYELLKEIKEAIG